MTWSQGEQGGDVARSQGRKPVAAGACGLVDELFAAQFAQIVGRLAEAVSGVVVPGEVVHVRTRRTDADLVSGQIPRGDAMLALAGLAEHNRDIVGRAARLDPPREPPGQPHQMRVVQFGVAVAVRPPPPHPKPARVYPSGRTR